MSPLQFSEKEYKDWVKKMQRVKAKQESAKKAKKAAKKGKR